MPQPAPSSNTPAAFVPLPPNCHQIVTTERGRYGTCPISIETPYSKTGHWTLTVTREGDGAQIRVRILVNTRRTKTGLKTTASVTGAGQPLGSFESLDAAIAAMTQHSIKQFEAEVAA